MGECQCNCYCRKGKGIEERNMKLTYEQIVSITQGVEYVEQKEEGIQFHRFTPDEERVYGASIFHPKQYATAGVRLHFKTDSTMLIMKVLTSKGSGCEYFAHDILVNGKWIGSLENGVEHAYGEFEQKFELGEGNKDVCIHFPWSVCSIVKELHLDDGSFLEAVKKDKKILMFGDSITQGYMAQNPFNCYASHLADILGAEGFNKAIGGEVFCPWLAESQNNLEPDYISVAYGTNHWNSSSSEELASICEGFFEKLVANYPKAKIFALTPIWRKDRTDITRFKSFEEIEEVIQNVVKKYDNAICISGRNFIPEDENLFADRYLHPNDKGFRYYTEGVKKALGF